MAQKSIAWVGRWRSWWWCPGGGRVLIVLIQVVLLQASSQEAWRRRWENLWGKPRQNKGHWTKPVSWYSSVISRVYTFLCFSINVCWPCLALPSLWGWWKRLELMFLSTFMSVWITWCVIDVCGRFDCVGNFSRFVCLQISIMLTRMPRGSQIFQFVVPLRISRNLCLVNFVEKPTNSTVRFLFTTSNLQFLPSPYLW